MKPNDYLSNDEISMIHDSMKSQIKNLKERLKDSKNFKKKEDWKKVSFVTEEGDNE